MDAFNHPGAMFPPAFDGAPLLYMATIWSLLMVNLLALEWSWRISWLFWERPRPLKHPETVLRLVLLLLVVGAIIRSGPDVVLLMSWADLTATGRYELARWDNLLDSVAFLPFSFAWLLGSISAPVLYFQLDRRPLPVHLWPTPSQLRRPLAIGLGVLGMSALLTLAR